MRGVVSGIIMLYDTALNNTEFSCATTMHGTMVGGESTIDEV